MKLNAKYTVVACFIGIINQALVINFSPLLFTTFESELGISLAKISTLIAISFITQLLMDFTASKLPRLFNKRITVVIGQICASVGLISLAVLPSILPPFIALIIATVIGAFGSGIIEVMGNPIIEACPIDNKNKLLTFMHSGYCWGLVLTVALSTLFFHFVGIEHWRLLACLWAIVPAVNAILFSVVPIYKMEAAPAKKSKERSIFHSFIFVAFFVLMVSAGAAEQAMSQWASTFAEQGLGVSKSIGDILGPCAFALLMGLARVLYAKYSEKMNLYKFMMFSSILCVCSYLLAALSPSPILSLIGCAICGFSVGIMWPGTLCMATEQIPHGGVKMFALLALAGDIGCTAGPTAAGFAAELAGNNLSVGFLVSILFPLLMIIFISLITRYKKRHSPLERT
ncbi:MAG: MFS transporter [Ruminococcaceae bacterium]|nr:MFS transporter [Oscillospiraceae bacterium]